MQSTLIGALPLIPLEIVGTLSISDSIADADAILAENSTGVSVVLSEGGRYVSVITQDEIKEELNKKTSPQSNRTVGQAMPLDPVTCLENEPVSVVLARLEKKPTPYILVFNNDLAVGLASVDDIKATQFHRAVTHDNTSGATLFGPVGKSRKDIPREIFITHSRWVSSIILASCLFFGSPVLANIMNGEMPTGYAPYVYLLAIFLIAIPSISALIFKYPRITLSRDGIRYETVWRRKRCYQWRNLGPFTIDYFTFGIGIYSAKYCFVCARSADNQNLFISRDDNIPVNRHNADVVFTLALFSEGRSLNKATEFVSALNSWCDRYAHAAPPLPTPTPQGRTMPKEQAP